MLWLKNNSIESRYFKRKKFMKPILFITILLGSIFVFAHGTELDDTSVVLADVLVKPKVRDCIDSALVANDVTNGNSGSFSVKEVET